MLLQELKTLCFVDCPALVKLHGAFLDEDNVTTVLEYMDSGSLEGLFANLKRNREMNNELSETVTAAIAFQTLEGLSCLHSDRILHRDIKPANLLLHSDGSVKLCDFGLSAICTEGDSFRKTAVGTAVYMAPERLRGKSYSRSSDIWSLGLVFLQCLTGQSPPWSQITAIVDLLVTIEDTNIDKHPIIEQKDASKGAKELLAGCLQHDPGEFSICCCASSSLEDNISIFTKIGILSLPNPAQRIPAALLRCSPWLLVHNLHTLEDARSVIKDFLLFFTE